MEKNLTDKKNSDKDEQIKVFALICVRAAKLLISLTDKWLKEKNL